jgi:hypothetical protein
MAYNVQNEVWGEFAGGAFIILMRFYARYRTIGVANFGIDDVFAGLALVRTTRPLSQPVPCVCATVD